MIVFIFAVYNFTFWGKAFEIFEGHSISLANYIVAIFFLTFFAFSFFAYPWTVKPFLAFILILSGVTSYYMDELGVIIDRDMIQNVMVTTFTESKHLITFGFVSHVVIFGIIPAVLMLLIPLKRQGKLRMWLTPVVMGAVALGLTLGLLMADLKSYSAILRERKDFMGSFQPGAPLVGAIRYGKMMARSAKLELQPIGEDAAKGKEYAEGGKPVLTVIVAGETARSQNFSLNGYARETNSELAKLPVVSFADVNSCGTATAVSLPCMFSRYGRKDYSYEKGISTENLLDVLAHAGFQVDWWDNNTGDKHIADRVYMRRYTHAENAELCGAGECMDGIFIDALKEYLAELTQDSVLVLHMIGSHGPTYYLRYPRDFAPFLPDCETAELTNCAPEEIVNSYDNTIAYTDKILAEIIGILQAHGEIDTSLIYVSDHGESLGEGGLFLHGAPYFMAPETQTKVPMILWLSEAFQDRFAINWECVGAKSAETLSHENLFHSVLGLLDVGTAEYYADLDIFASCKKKVTAALQ